MQSLISLIFATLIVINCIRGISKQEELRYELEKENILSGYWQFMKYFGNRLPAGTFSINLQKFIDHNDSPRVKQLKQEAIKLMRQGQIITVGFIVFAVLGKILK